MGSFPGPERPELPPQQLGERTIVGGHDHLPAVQHVLEGLGLMRVELGDASRLNRGTQPRIDARRERRVCRFHRRQAANRRDDVIRGIGAIECLTRVENAQCFVEGSVLGLGRGGGGR